jgi:hypothetical protein
MLCLPGAYSSRRLRFSGSTQSCRPGSPAHCWPASPVSQWRDSAPQNVPDLLTGFARSGACGTWRRLGHAGSLTVSRSERVGRDQRCKWMVLRSFPVILENQSARQSLQERPSSFASPYLHDLETLFEDTARLPAKADLSDNEICLRAGYLGFLLATIRSTCKPVESASAIVQQCKELHVPSGLLTSPPNVTYTLFNASFADSLVFPATYLRPHPGAALLAMAVRTVSTTRIIISWTDGRDLPR